MKKKKDTNWGKNELLMYFLWKYCLLKHNESSVIQRCARSFKQKFSVSLKRKRWRRRKERECIKYVLFSRWQLWWWKTDKFLPQNVLSNFRNQFHGIIMVSWRHRKKKKHRPHFAYTTFLFLLQNGSMRYESIWTWLVSLLKLREIVSLN